MVGDRYHQYAGTVFGFVFTIGGLGGMIAPAIVGHVSQAYGVRSEWLCRSWAQGSWR